MISGAESLPGIKGPPIRKTWEVIEDAIEKDFRLGYYRKFPFRKLAVTDCWLSRLYAKRAEIPGEPRRGRREVRRRASPHLLTAPAQPLENVREPRLVAREDGEARPRVICRRELARLRDVPLSLGLESPWPAGRLRRRSGRRAGGATPEPTPSPTRTAGPTRRTLARPPGHAPIGVPQGILRPALDPAAASGRLGGTPMWPTTNLDILRRM